MTGAVDGAVTRWAPAAVQISCRAAMPLNGPVPGGSRRVIRSPRTSAVGPSVGVCHSGSPGEGVTLSVGASDGDGRAGRTRIAVVSRFPCSPGVGPRSSSRTASPAFPGIAVVRGTATSVPSWTK